MELNDYKHRVNDRRYIEVEITCDYCKKPYWAKWSRVNKGLARFCSRKCSSLYRANGSPLQIGKENAYKYFEEKRQVWLVYWFDEDRKRHNSTLARWLWEQDGRIIPPKHIIYYKDNDPNNCVLDNLYLVSKSKLNSMLLVGHKVSEEAKNKVSLGNSGKVRTQESKDKISRSLRRRWKSGEFNSIHVGENNRRWKGGVKPYPAEFNDDLRATVKLRDDSKCQICNKAIFGRNGHVHHIDGNKKNNSMDNLILLCVSCHATIHNPESEREATIRVFRSKLKM